MKKSKKFVLAGLALLAITGLLALAGCKNDSVPEPTRYTVKFETDHGTAPDDITVVSGTKLTDKDLAIEPEVGDNIFEYWYDKDVDVQKPVEEGYTVTKDVTLVAKWRDRGTVASVTFSPAGDTKFYCDESIAVSLTSEEGATIQYHLGDGSWKDYDAGRKIQVTGDTTITTITARAAKDGLKPSAVISATYTVRKLEDITVTPPARTVSSVGEEVVHKKDDEIRVTATYDDGTTRTVTGTITTDTRTLTQSAGIGKKVTVSYSEGGSPVTKDFPVDVVNVEEPTKLTSYSSPNSTGSKWTYVAFGEWPQTEAVGFKPTTTPKSHGIFVDNYYVEGNDKYVEKDGKYYKVEPIVWRVLTDNYIDADGITGNALLLAEKILTGGIPYYHFDRKGGSVPRNIEDKTIHPNNYEHSQIRAWLNGLSYQSKESGGAMQSSKDEYKNAGFLQTAFTESARELIADTSVDNSAASTNPASNDKEWNSGTNPYASDTPTTDKVFLLSEHEATTESYGFAIYSDSGKGNTRIRVITDYAKATGAYQYSTEGWWWLRSPFYYYEDDARVINDYGYASDRNKVHYSNGGVVPALSISLTEN